MPTPSHRKQILQKIARRPRRTHPTKLLYFQVVTQAVRGNEHYQARALRTETEYPQYIRCLNER
jgi:hypothetical protein